MPDDTGGPAFREGPDHGGADDEFAAVILDEEFVRGAPVHEPSADERIAAAVEARMRDRPSGGRSLGGPGFAPPAEIPGAAVGPGGPEASGVYGPYDGHAPYEPYGAEFGDHARAAVRRQRLVAWVLAVVMGIGVLAMAVSAVYRSASNTPATRPVDSAPAGDGQNVPHPARPGAGVAAP